MQHRILTEDCSKHEFLELSGTEPKWILLYSVADFPLQEVLSALRTRYPRAEVFGATSFRGVFTPRTFTQAAACLIGEESDQIAVAPVLNSAGAAEARMEARLACESIEQRLGAPPDLILMHATPGFEERVIEGIEDCFHGRVPVYGGSAADDGISGRWRIFQGSRVESLGTLLVGFRSPRPIHAGFLGGYLPTNRTGRVTAVRGRVVEAIDGRPAAQVYSEWTHGLVDKELVRGGVVLFKTDLHPIGRIVNKSAGVPRWLLSHPHEVLASGALSFFTEFSEGEEITLMSGTQGPLLTRIGKAVRLSLGTGMPQLRGGLFVYCAGCLEVVLNNATEISADFRRTAGDIPFVGVSTLGEVGAFGDLDSQNRHGNLMCSTVLFE